MTTRRTLFALTVFAIMAVWLLYDEAPTPVATYTPPPNCDSRYQQRGLGWESWEIVYDCE